MKRSLLLLSISLLAGLNSCNNLVKVKLLKPSEVNLGNIKNISIIDFKFKGFWQFNEYNSVDNISSNPILNAFFDNTKSPVDPFQIYSGKNISKSFIDALNRNGRYKIIENNSILELINYDKLEKGLSKSDILALKQKFNIDAVIFGSGSYSVIENGNLAENKYLLTRKLSSEFTYKILNTNNSLIIASKNNSLSESEDITGNNENDARNKLNNWKNELENQVNKLTDISVKQIAPYYATENREIKDGKSSLMKNGFEFAKREFWDDARKNWEEVIRTRASLPKEMQDDGIFAMYNMGVYYEVKGDYDKSAEMYQRCYDATFDESYLTHRKRVENRKSEIKELKKQNIDIKN